MTESTKETAENTADQLVQALQLIERLKAEREQVKEVVFGLLDFLGLLEPGTKNLRPGIINGEDSVMSELIPVIGEVGSLLMKCQMPVIGKRYEKEMEEKFSFFKKIIPIVENFNSL